MSVQITFDPHLAHALEFRHGPRDEAPPPFNVWDYWRLLSPKAAEIAQLMRTTYLPEGFAPDGLWCSQLPRSSQTLGIMWPKQISTIVLDRRLGIEFEDIATKWAQYDKHPDMYEWTPQRQHALDPALVDACGLGLFRAASDPAAGVGVGKVGVGCSLMPIADSAARHANKLLGLHVDNDGWLPGKGFGSGAFVHFAFTAARELVHCQYYPVPG